jgi:hypothetical protein
MKKVALVCLVLGVVSASGTYAAIQTYSNSFSGQSFNIIGQLLSVPQFNPSDGILNSVSITVSVGAYGETGMENHDGVLTNRHFKTFFQFPDEPLESTHGQLGLSLASQVLANVSWDVQNDYLVNLTSFDGVDDFAGTSGFKVTYLNSQDNKGYNYSSNLSSFIGTGTVDFVADGTAFSAMSVPGGNAASFMSTQGSAAVGVTYDYTIPEPATMAILAIGGMILLQRKKA